MAGVISDVEAAKELSKLKEDNAENDEAAISTSPPASPGIPDDKESIIVPVPAISNNEAQITEEENKPYSAFSPGQKWFIVICSAVAAIFSGISSNIYVPAIPTLAREFGVSSEKINLTITTYLIFQALTPAMWGSAADCFGRRPVYVTCLTIYIFSCLGTALCPTDAYWLLLIMRIVQAAGGAATIAIGVGVVSDITLPQERGTYMGAFQLANNFGPLGHCLEVFSREHLVGVQFFWFLMIFCAVILVIMLFFFPETLRSLVGDGSIPPPLLNCTPAVALQRRRALRELKARGETSLPAKQRMKYKPWASFELLLQPDLIMNLVWMSTYYANWYAVLTIFSTLLQDEYGAGEILIGLCYIPHGLACGIGGFSVGKIMDIFYRREKARVGGDHRQKEDFRLERTRYMVQPVLCGLQLVATIGLGWSFKAHAHISVPVILNFFVGFSTANLSASTIYTVGLFPGQGGAVAASFNLVRCLFGAAAVAVVQIINHAIGPGWTFVLFSGICIVATPLPLIVLRYGPHFRKKRAKARRKKDEEEQAALQTESRISTRTLATAR